MFKPITKRRRSGALAGKIVIGIDHDFGSKGNHGIFRDFPGYEFADEPVDAGEPVTAHADLAERQGVTVEGAGQLSGPARTGLTGGLHSAWAVALGEVKKWNLAVYRASIPRGEGGYSGGGSVGGGGGSW